MAHTAAPYSLDAARRVILHTQGLATPNGAESPPTSDTIYDVVAKTGCIQIDTLQMVRRSQYVAIWSRLGCYSPDDLDRLIYREPRRLFEGWMHAACILPLSDYRYVLPLQRHRREHPSEWFKEWMVDPVNAALLDEVMECIRRDGPAAVGDFEYDGPARQGWWDFKPAKHALTHRYAWGELMIADRVNFACLYDLTERVLPAWVDTTEPSRPELIHYVVERATRTFGACRRMQIANYYHSVNATDAKPFIEEMLAEGALASLSVDAGSGKTLDMVVHRDSLSLLEQAADGALPAQRTTFLSPFDSLFWPMHGDVEVWGFRKSLEAYLPAPKRRWGYFCLPILHRDRLIGRFDPKLERATGTLRLKALYLEPGVAPHDDLVAAVAAAMRDFLAFHDARNLVIERSDPPEFATKLLAAL
jgi:uncharacterized protein YcaQ